MTPKEGHWNKPSPSGTKQPSTCLGGLPLQAHSWLDPLILTVSKFPPSYLFKQGEWKFTLRVTTHKKDRGIQVRLQPPLICSMDSEGWE